MTSPRPTQEKIRSGLAIAVSALLHLVFFLAVFATATGTAPRGAADPFGEGEAVEVMLAGREGARAGGAAASEAISDVERLAQRISTPWDFAVSEPEQARPNGDLSSLFKALGRFDATGTRGDGREALGDGAKAGREAKSASSTTRGEATLDASAGELWGQVEPCWRRLAGRSAVPVTLEVTLDGKGGLATPPRIVRPDGGRPSEQRLLAEARALEAIRACLPYKAPGVIGAGRAYRLAFRAAGNGR